MKKIAFIILMGLLFNHAESKAQILLNVLQLNSIDLEWQKSKLDTQADVGAMVLAYNSGQVMIFQNESFSYWLDYSYKQCGKNSKLSGKTFVLTKEGEKIHGNRIHSKRKKGEGGPDFLLGRIQDEFNITGDDEADLKANFKYVIRCSN